MAATSYESIPQEMRALPQWVCHRGGGKVPIDPNTGRNAKANDPGTWGTFEEAVAWATDNGGGIGFEFTEGDPFCGIDLDHVVGEDGELAVSAREIVDALDTYTEFSPSGTGLHLIARAEKPGGESKRTNQDGTASEMYDHGRYFRMTGNVYDGHGAIRDRQEAVSGVHARYVARVQERAPREPSAAQDALGWNSEVVVTDGGRDRHDVPLTADAALGRMRRSARWSEIAPLWDGDTTPYGGDHSAADMALCNHLAYFCDRDERLMDELFRRSGLMRGKWDEVHHPGDPFPTYGSHAIHNAASTCRECHSERHPSPSPSISASGAFVSLYDVTGDNLPSRDPEMVSGILRERQVMLIAAPSKAGKTWLAVALMWALATGGEWLGARCARTRVVYCNMEVSPASFANRCEAVRGEMGIPHDAARMVDVLSGRGAGYDANRLVEAVLVHLGGTPACVVVDCLYAIETGNENDAEAIRALFAELNRLTRAGCSVVGVHHFPKGSSGMKASVDRMAGSSVFARAPDALLSLDPLDVDPRGEAGAELAEQGYSAYRLSFDLRDFRPRRPIDLIFTGTRFVRDVGGLLGGAYIKGSPQANGAHSGRANAERAEADWKRKAALVGEAVSAAALEGANPTMEYVRDYYNSHRGGYGLARVSVGTIANWTKPSNDVIPFVKEGGIVVAVDDVGRTDVAAEAYERTPTV